MRRNRFGLTLVLGLLFILLILLLPLLLLLLPPPPHHRANPIVFTPFRGSRGDGGGGGSSSNISGRRGSTIVIVDISSMFEGVVGCKIPRKENSPIFGFFGAPPFLFPRVITRG